MDVGSGCGDGSRSWHSVRAQIGRTWPRIGWDGGPRWMRRPSGENKRWRIEMPVPSNDDPSAFRPKTQHDAWSHVSTWHRVHAWNAHDTQKTPAKRVIRKRTNTTTHGACCWRCSRCQAPDQRYFRTCRIGKYAGWHCRRTSRWTLCTKSMEW